jgi:hypothetical protein
MICSTVCVRVISKLLTDFDEIRYKDRLNLDEGQTLQFFKEKKKGKYQYT